MILPVAPVRLNPVMPAAKPHAVAPCAAEGVQLAAGLKYTAVTEPELAGENVGQVSTHWYIVLPVIPVKL